MHLYLIRHGEAMAAGTDVDRALTAQGCEEAKTIATRLKGRIKKVDRLIYSTRRRARETALIIGDILDCKGLCKEHMGLGPDDPIQPMANEILEASVTTPSDSTWIVVGHLPYVHKLADSLVASRQLSMLTFPTGCAAYFTSESHGSWAFEEMIIP